MNVVRFKLRSDCVENYFKVVNETNFEGMTQRYIAKTGNYDYCFVGIWEKLGVTDPVFGNIVSKVCQYDR